MITDAIGYLKKSDDVWKTTIIGGVLLLFGFLLLPLFVAWGYVVRVIDRTAHGDDEAPVFEDWEGLLVDGVKAVAIMLAYSLVPVVVGAVLVGGVWLAAGETVGTPGVAAMLLGGLITVGAFVAAAYAFPAALANYAETRRIGSGFDRETLRPILWSRRYATGWLVSLGIILAGSIVTAILNEIPMIGILLGSIVTFYALVAAYYVIGQTWEELHPVRLPERGAGGERSSDRPAV